MRKQTLASLIVLAALVAGPAHASGVIWENPGGAPWAKGTTGDDRVANAVGRFDEAFTLLSEVPAAVKEKLRAQVAAARKGEATRHLDPDDELDAMVSGPDKDHRTDHVMRDVAIACIAVPGQPGRCQSMKAAYWRVEHDGVVWHFFVPEDCGNWAYRKEDLPPPVVECPPTACLELTLTDLEPGDRISVNIRSGKHVLPASECWSIEDGPGSARVWDGQLYCYEVKSRTVTFRLPLIVREDGWEVVLCRQTPTRLSRGTVVVKDDWQENRFHHTADIWRWQQG